MDSGKKRVRQTTGGDVSGAGVPAVVNVAPITPEYPTRTKDKVAIVGFADGHRDDAPFDDPSFEVWGLNRLHAVLPGKRFDRWFEIHSVPKYYLGGDGQPVDTDHLEFLRSFAGPVYLRPQDMGTIQCPSAVPYQIEAVLRDFGSYQTNSITYMIEYAVAMRFKEIHLFGVDMAQDSLFSAEYASQRPSCEFVLGIAVGRGIKIFKPPGSDLLLCDHLYGFDDGSPMMLKRVARLRELGKRKDAIRGKLAELEAQKETLNNRYWQEKLALTAQINQMDGAQQEIVYEARNLTAPPEVKPPTQIASASPD